MKIVVFTGAGVSADSGIPTYRSSDGLWANYKIEEVCTPEALAADRAKVINFYNMRRREALAAQPNAAHYAIARLQEVFPNTEVITQNIDNLHERAGSQDVIHLHGEITKLRSEINQLSTVDLEGWEQHYGDRHPDGSLLRPYVVFFGEDVPYFPLACEVASEADILIVVGTSLNVYPAAFLLQYAPQSAEIYVIDPNTPELGIYRHRAHHIQKNATIGVPELVDKLILSHP